MTKSYLLSILFAVVFITTGLSQKYAYINSTELLIAMPQVKTADSQLETYQKTLMTKGETMEKAFQTEYNKYVTEAQGGTLTGLQMQQKESALGQQQQEIQQYAAEVQQLLGAKKQELYEPILQRVRDVVEEIGKSNGYTMIFDGSVGGLLFAKDADNLMVEVKAKLGL